MRVTPRQAVVGLIAAGIAGGFLLLPAVSFLGTLMIGTLPVPSRTHVPPLVAEAIWARALGGRATTLQPLNPFTIGKVLGCHVLAERADPAQRGQEHDRCMALLPGVTAMGYLSTVHMRSEGVWQDPRVPFVQIALMTKMADSWTREELIDTLAARGEFGFGFQGIDAAARGYFGRDASEVNVPQAAMLAAYLGDRRVDPWCDAAGAAQLRHRVLEGMLDNGAIDAEAFRTADLSDIGVIAPPSTHPPCQ